MYLELTFWAKEKPPAKKKAPRPSTSNPQYGGPGSFTPSSSASEIPAALRPNREASPTHSQAPDRRAAVPVPDSLKPSSSALGDLNLYIPPYNSQSSLGSNNSLTGIEPGRGGYDELGVMGPGYDHGRRDSFPVSSLSSPIGGLFDLMTRFVAPSSGSTAKPLWSSFQWLYIVAPVVSAASPAL